MIISDTPHHKIDAEFNKDGWLHITAFSRKTDTEWISKMIGIGPEAQQRIVKMIEDKLEEKMK